MRSYYTALLLAFSLIPASAGATISLTLVSDPDFGSIFSGTSGRHFILTTAGTIGGSDASDHVSGAVAGNITVGDDTASSTLQIEATAIAASGGVSVTSILCAYDGGTETRCDNGGFQVTSASNATLAIGLEISTTQIHSGGQDSTITFDMEITYV